MRPYSVTGTLNLLEESIAQNDFHGVMPDFVFTSTTSLMVNKVRVQPHRKLPLVATNRIRPA
jgi:hypothetical protein